jgi:hypothetical protein
VGERKREGWPSVLGPREARRHERVGWLGQRGCTARARADSPPGADATRGRGRGRMWGPRGSERERESGIAAGLVNAPVRPSS